MAVNKYLQLLTMLAVVALFLSCKKEEETVPPSYSIPANTKYYDNPPYPVDADTLHILALGNSFSNDAMTYIDTLIKASGIDEGRLCLYEAAMRAASFDTWIKTYRDKTPLDMVRRAGKVTMANQGTLPQLLNQPWDVIIVQQVSNKSYVWSSYTSLKEYVELITSSCPNKKVCLAFQLVWSHTPDEMPRVLRDNITCCQYMSRLYGIDVIIPTGTAIQLARATYLNDDSYMTRDNWHLNTGIASYIASCTWYEKLFTPVFDVPVADVSSIILPGYSEADMLLARQCAERAIQNPYIWKYEQ